MVPLPKLALLVCLLAPVPALADIYMWTDERGGTVISDERPENPSAVRNFKVLVKESERGPRTEVRLARQDPTPNEQMLQDRVEQLERELQEQRYPPPDLPPANTYSSGYYALPAPAPAAVYGSDFYAPYYAVPPAYVVLGATTFTTRPFSHKPFGHRHLADKHFGHKHFGHTHFGDKHFAHRQSGLAYFNRGQPILRHGGRGFSAQGFSGARRSSFAGGRVGTARR
jgi:hypothetical protein